MVRNAITIFLQDILKNFTPILDTFGDLGTKENFNQLVNAVSEFVEANPVPWMDRNKTPIIFNRDDISKRCEDQRTLMAISKLL